MKKEFSVKWKASKQPRKQRKYRHNAPLHVLIKFMSAPLSKELRKKYSTRSINLRKGDRVKVMKGTFKGKIGKVEKVMPKRGKVFVENVQITKKDGSKAHYPIMPSNLLILELELSDKLRKKRLESKSKGANKNAS